MLSFVLFFVITCFFFSQSFLHCNHLALGWERELIYVFIYFAHVIFYFFYFFFFYFFFFFFLSFFYCSWFQMLAATCDCGTPWTCLLTFLMSKIGFSLSSFYTLYNYSIKCVYIIKYTSNDKWDNHVTVNRTSQFLEVRIAARAGLTVVCIALSLSQVMRKCVLLHITGIFLKRDYKMKSLFLFKLCCFWGVKSGQKV